MDMEMQFPGDVGTRACAAAATSGNPSAGDPLPQGRL